MTFITKPDSDLKRVGHSRPFRVPMMLACSVAKNLLVLPVCLGLAVQSLAVSPGDVVINEIAWMGTGASANDEWIELHNTTDQEIDLTNWLLEAFDATPTIALFGAIAPHGYFLLERTDNDTVSDIVADQIYGNDGSSWALKNTGEILYLKDPSGRVIDTANSDGGSWPAGANPSGNPAGRATMERISYLASDSDANWATNNGVIRNGFDAANQSINGTPKARNSATNPPIADFTYVPGHPTTWDTIQFVDRSSDLDGTVIGWLWTFGDGNTSREQNPTCQYDNAGTYQVTLEVTDEDGLKGSTFQEISVDLGPGDVDGNGMLDVLDVRIVLQAALGLITLTPEQLLRADVDGDGHPTRTDAERLAAHIIGIGD